MTEGIQAYKNYPDQLQGQTSHGETRPGWHSRGTVFQPLKPMLKRRGKEFHPGLTELKSCGAEIRTLVFGNLPVFFLILMMMTGCAATLPELKRPLPRGEELVTLPTRPGVTVRILLITPKSTPSGTFIFYPGGDGSLVNTEGRGKWLYTRMFPERGFTTAMVDVPSDRPFGMIGGDRFKSSKEHLEDLKSIIDFIFQKWPKPIYLIGHSAGATSAAYLATVLKDQRIDGVVLTSAVGDGSLATVPLHTIAYPVLFVHHREDPCTSFEAAYRQHYRLIESSRVNFIEVLGGDQSRAIGCKPRNPGFGLSWAHGFSGKEHEVVSAITDWVTGKPTPNLIGP
jgi:dienelactone hydrolase